MSTLTHDGAELFDQTPINLPFRVERPTPLHIRMRQQILALQQEMQYQSEVETPEEADDFSVEDEPDMWQSPYELDFDHISDTESTDSVSESVDKESQPATKEPETEKA